MATRDPNVTPGRLSVGCRTGCRAGGYGSRSRVGTTGCWDVRRRVLISLGLIVALVPIALLIQRKLHGPEEGNPYVAYINRIDREISRLAVPMSPVCLLVGLIMLLVA